MSKPLAIHAAAALGLITSMAVTPLSHAGPVAASAPMGGASVPTNKVAAKIGIKKPIVPGDKPVTTQVPAKTVAK